MPALNERQTQAVNTIDGPLLIVAGAGSGKTRVVTYRIIEMLKRGISEKNILALTFTNKAAGEMKQRVKEVMAGKTKQITISTFHAFGATLLREHITRIGYSPSFSIYDQYDRLSLLKEVMNASRMEDGEGTIYGLSQLYSAIKSGRVSWSEDTMDLRPLYQEYQAHLKAYNAVDFDDLITLPNSIMEKDEDVRVKLRDRYRYILVDEFQDTSLAQYKLLKNLAQKYRNLCVVGDDDQSIYSWRGANYENLELFERDFSERIEIKLEQNYRSARYILEAANSVIVNNARRKTKQLWTGMGGEGSIELSLLKDEAEEARFIGRMIRTEALKREIGFDEFGVLVRTNNLMTTIEDGLMSDNIPYRISGGKSFFERKEIRDFIAYLRVLANPDDDQSLLRIINTPRRGIGRRSVEEIRSIAAKQDCSLFSAIKAALHASDSPLSGRASEKFEVFADLIDLYAEKDKKLSVSNIVEDLSDRIDYLGHLVQEHPGREELAKYRYKNIQTFVGLIRSWERDPDNFDITLHSFLQRLSLISREDMEDEPDSEKINLTTIHAAKGLEFSVVILAGVDDHLIPHARSLEEAEGSMEEERRLFYVAMTRAKYKLYLTSCRVRSFARRQVECKPSRFLQEIPQNLIKHYDRETPVASEEAADLFARMKARWQ